MSLGFTACLAGAHPEREGTGRVLLSVEEDGEVRRVHQPGGQDRQEEDHLSPGTHVSRPACDIS